MIDTKMHRATEMLAIVIPFYKAKFFDATLKSLAAQTDKRFKVYIGDDGSPEDIKKLLANYRDHFCFEYKRFDENIGKEALPRQWERCVKMTTGEKWVLLLGDDDVLGDGVVAAFYKNVPLKAEAINSIRYASCTIDENGMQTSKVFFNPTIESAIDFFFKKQRSSLSEYVFKVTKINEVGFKNFELGWCSDILAVLEFSDFGAVYSINEALVNVRISSQSISGNQDNHKLKFKAAFRFLYYLIANKKAHFTDFQQKKILEEISKVYLNQKKNLFFFTKISIQYWIRGLFREYCIFILSFFKIVFKIK